MVVEIIQANFAPGDDLGFPGQLFKFGECALISQLGFMGMDTDGGVDEIVPFGQLDAAIHASWAIAISNCNDGLHTSFARPRDYLLAVSCELLAIEVSMGI